jgi:hypothetical protein
LFAIAEEAYRCMVGDGTGGGENGRGDQTIIVSGECSVSLPAPARLRNATEWRAAHLFLSGLVGVVDRESGAGKTVSAKYIMRYFATVDDPNKPGKKKVSCSPLSAAGSVADHAPVRLFGDRKQVRFEFALAARGVRRAVFAAPPVLHTILHRYSLRSIYTYSGIVLVAVNMHRYASSAIANKCGSSSPLRREAYA